MPTYTAEWILPISDEPIERGFVTIDSGRIAAVGDGIPQGARPLGRVALLPALVNAHTHLELSYLRGRIARRERFLDWIRDLMAARREFPDASDPVIVDAARRAIAYARASGTGLFGDISNTLVTAPLLRDARMPARVFYELLGFNASDPEARLKAARDQIARAGLHGSDNAGVDLQTRPRAESADDIRVSLAPHAPYSVSPALFQAIRADLDAHAGDISSVHLGESPEEVEFTRRGTGPWRAMLEDLGVWSDDWRAPGTSPVTYLSDLGFLDRCVLAVHGVQFDGEDLTRLGALGVTIVSCPRSNEYVGVGAPPLEAFYAMDVDVAFGTDSLASAPDLNVFSELKAARRLAPRVPAARLLESATLIGARALGFGRDYGSIEAGKRASLIAVRVPEHVTDVQEYLVGGIEPDAIQWLDR
ncbi:MAG TPA: amidohydrolase family protein [Vicinamibacterales bacterium]|nr:amidohydrolase family protein [Vicinamibacterales bacterium]